MINSITLVGRLTADPEIRYTQSGKPVVNFQIAVERNYKNSAGEKETDFIYCVAWNKTAELIHQYVKKSTLLGIEGALRMNKYKTKEGENRTKHEVEINNMQFLGSPSGKSGGSQKADAPDRYGSYDPEDGLPF